jgi:hypothetical protein
VVILDEVHGFFEEIYSKRYLTGVAERLTDLYDGHVRVSLRATREATQRADNVKLNFVGVGIRSLLADVLSNREFQSGLLARFVWAVGYAPKVIEDSYISLGEYNKKYIPVGDDDFIVEFLNSSLITLRSMQEEREIEFANEDVYKRWDRFHIDIVRAAHNSDRRHNAVPSAERLSFTALRLAALLALVDGSYHITMRHLYQAIIQCEIFYADMMIMAREVSMSSFAKMSEELLSYIKDSKSAGRDLTDIYKMFSNEDSQTVVKMMSTLNQRQQIKRNKEGKWIVVTR